jgi:multimeric flavodoxin WrbA
VGTAGQVAAKEDVMTKVVAINGSPSMQKGNTAMILNPFIEGMQEAGAEVGLFFANRLKVEPCTGGMICWYQRPGECYIEDDMQTLFPKLREAEILVLATPVYIPLPGEMQNVINRLVPLLERLLETCEGRTRARFRQEVNIRKFVVVATGGWWEKANLDPAVRIVKELASVANVEFARPHSFLMRDGSPTRKERKSTEDGAAVVNAAKRAGVELVQQGVMSEETLAMVSRPLISQEDLRLRYNQAL